MVNVPPRGVDSCTCCRSQLCLWACSCIQLGAHCAMIEIALADCVRSSLESSAGIWGLWVQGSKWCDFQAMLWELCCRRRIRPAPRRAWGQGRDWGAACLSAHVGSPPYSDTSLACHPWLLPCCAVSLSLTSSCLSGCFSLFPLVFSVVTRLLYQTCICITEFTLNLDVSYHFPVEHLQLSSGVPDACC